MLADVGAALTSSASAGPLSKVSHDWLFAGTLSVRQPARRTGYRVNVDAILLAAFAARVLPGGQPRGRSRARHTIDLGAGVGAVGLTLLHLDATATVTMIEIDDVLADLASKNAAENGWTDRTHVVRADVRYATKELGAEADLVVCNPPYVVPGRGRAPSERVRSAKYGDLQAFVEAARRIAGRRARTCFVYPAIEATTLLTTLRDHGLEPKRLRPVHGRANDKARVVLVESVPGKPGGLSIEPPFVETDGRSRSADLAALLTTPRG